MEILLPIISGLAVMVVSLIGVIFTNQYLGKWLNNNLNLLVSVAAGTFAFLVYNLARESIELLGDKIALLIIFSAFIVSWVGFKLIPFFHHHHSKNSGHEHSQGEGRKILTADAIHNTGDGIIIVAGFAISPALGLITTVGVLLHELVQELSEYFVLRRAGYSNKQALTRNFQISATILVGIFLGLSLQGLGVEPYLLAITAGLFLTIVLQDLLPDTIEAASKPGKLLPYVSAFMIGVAVMMGLGEIAGHGHAHDHEDHEEL